MITENLSTLKIHKLTQAQYDRELEAGRVDENALYLTPEEDFDLSDYATKESVEAQLNNKQNKIIGAAGQVVGFDANGNAVAQDMPNADITVDTEVIEGSENPVSGGAVYEAITNFGNLNIVNGEGEGSLKTVGAEEASGEHSFAEGGGTIAVGRTSHAEGEATFAEGYASHAEGNYTFAIGDTSHAEGYDVLAMGEGSHAEGYGYTVEIFLTGEAGATTYIVDNVLTLTDEMVINYCNTFARILSIDENNSTITLDTTLSENEVLYESWAFAYMGPLTSGYASHAEGYGTHAKNDCSHAEGDGTSARGYASHAEGRYTNANGEGSHAEGEATFAEGDYSHTEGYWTSADGDASHAEGENSHAEGDYSHAEGYATYATSRSQHVQGEYNLMDSYTPDSRGAYAHVVGNGESNDDRSNAHTLDWEGNAWFSGDVYVGSTSGTNKDEGSRKLATITIREW